jgi:hypothetical protein
MEIKGKVHCFFEQSGTFKQEFIKLGIPAEDYDIQNNFGQTDHIDDLFEAIETAYGGGAKPVRQYHVRRPNNSLLSVHIFLREKHVCNDLPIHKLLVVKRPAKDRQDIRAEQEPRVFLSTHYQTILSRPRARFADDRREPVFTAALLDSHGELCNEACVD